MGSGGVEPAPQHRPRSEASAPPAADDSPPAEARDACSRAALSASTIESAGAALAACSTRTVLVGTMTFTARMPGFLSRMEWMSGTSLGQHMPCTLSLVCVDGSAPPRCSESTANTIASGEVMSILDPSSPWSPAIIGVLRTRGMYLAPSAPPALLLATFTAPWSTTPGVHPWWWSSSLHVRLHSSAQSPPQCSSAPVTTWMSLSPTTKSTWLPWGIVSTRCRKRNALACSGSDGICIASSSSGVSSWNELALSLLCAGMDMGRQVPSSDLTTSWPSMR
mmetsp:Transcript_15046/g.58870  ORF Transcript_15046/g.58870 Transcript_15046/m.58870 type:complete len:279 (-) Transcript_15046:353-1189(-)